MSNTKIFGEEHFIDNRMVELIEAKNKAMDNIVFNEMEKSINITLPFVKVNAEKLRNWVLLCIKLENIDKSDLVECAVRKKFADKDNEISKLKAELEELKENNIETKFKVGQTIYTPFVGAAEDILVFEIKHISIEWSSAYKKHFVYYYIDDKYYYEEKQLFSTKKEALKKLEENKND